MNREEKLGITADRLKDHYGYYVQLAAAVGIGWPEADPKFMGHNLDYWKRLYAEDKHLNNHPLKYFDAHYGPHWVFVAPRPGYWSMSDTVCCLKAVIRDRILKNQGQV